MTGVILNLAIWFALHVLFARVAEVSAGPFHLAWPEWTSLNPAALLLAMISALMLFRFKAGTFLTLAVCGAAGMAISYAGLA